MRVGSRFLHPGTVAVRGPAAPDRAAYCEYGLSVEQASAIEFVGAWFGAPFDAVTYARSAVLCWGVWGLGGPALMTCLARWKRRAPEAFDRILRSRGLDVAEDGGACALVLAEDPAPVRADEEIDASVGRNHRLVAALVLAGREPSAQMSQIEAAVNGSIVPALALELGVSSGTIRAGDVLKSPRALAVLFYSVLHFGLGTTSRLLQAAAHATHLQAQAPDEGALLERWTAPLRRPGCNQDLHGFLQILTSPELRLS